MHIVQKAETLYRSVCIIGVLGWMTNQFMRAAVEEPNQAKAGLFACGAVASACFSWLGACGVKSVFKPE